jgi:hypothetical protein
MATTIRKATWGFEIEPDVPYDQDLYQAIAEDECQRWSRTHDGAFVEIVRNPQRGSNRLRQSVLFWEVVYVDFGSNS